jgi:hypothetical protein
MNPDPQLQFRGALVELAGALLLGPLEKEEFLESAPGDTYLTGILWPRHTSAETIDDDLLSSGGGVEDDDGGVPGYRSIKPCSLGLTFTVPATAVVEISLGTTSRYVPRAAEDVAGSAKVGDKGDGRGSRPALRWQRTSLDYRILLRPAKESSASTTSQFLDAEGRSVSDPSIVLHLKRRVADDRTTITVTLINASPSSDDEDFVARERNCIFQTQLVVRALVEHNSSVILARERDGTLASDPDSRSNSLIYRKSREFGIGHGVAVEWPPAKRDTVTEVRTSWLPGEPVRGMNPDGHGMLETVVKDHARLFSAQWLAEGPRQGVCDALSAFAECYGRWIEGEVAGRLGEFEGEMLDAATENLARCRDVRMRLAQSVEMLRSDDDDSIWSAFQLSNLAMDRQSRFAVKGDRKGPLTWRPFQLAYIVMVIPSLADPTLQERECMDLLWFPTGGGKTEAYLALTAFQIFFRRIQSPIARDRAGVDVLMRYTLRLLTVQQFQRAAALISACDLIREERADVLGSTRISIGLYVGRDTTPNKMNDAREALESERRGETPKSTPRQLLECPVCGRPMARDQYRPSATEPRLDVHCSAESCPTAGRTLPIMTVDECIYATPPSLLIATIDKFAQLPRRVDLRVLFGLDGGLAPGLVIQDELHLIAGPLGSMAGLYETAIDMLCTRGTVRPKIIGSTATIGRAEQQVRALFDRTVLQFPPPAIDAEDSFFAVRDDSGPDRLYLGVTSAGRSPKFALQAVMAALLQAAQKLAESATDPMTADPYWTVVTYFNSLRELGGAWVLAQDDVPRQMMFLGRRLGDMEARPLPRQPAELSSRVASRDIPEMLRRLGARRDADPEEDQAEDIVLASNMISVGVDIPRLGLMLVNGQPKTTSEYIQATSRVGRGLPGLVVTLYNFGRPRDLSHFEHFKKYHSALYSAVEATSVTPWAPRARDKGLPAVLIGTARHLIAGLDAEDAASRLVKGDPAMAAIVKSFVKRSGIASDWLEDADTAQELADLVERWEHRAAESVATGKRLVYWERKSRFGNASQHLLRSAEEGPKPGVRAWAAPGSLREVEPSTAFMLKS